MSYPGTYIRTFSGRKFTVEPTPDCVDLHDIAHVLARTPRWGGHSTLPFSVAAHSIFVASMVARKHRLQALLHDASEAYLCDIPSPFKALLPDYKALEAKIMAAVSQKFGISWPMHPQVKRADGVALYEERKHLFSLPVGEDVPHAPLELFNPDVSFDFAFWTSQSPHTVELHYYLRVQQAIEEGKEAATHV